MATPPNFFISYNQADREWAEWIAGTLEQAGYTTVLQAWDFPPGSNFVLEMHNAARQAERTIAVLSPEYLASGFTAPEWAAAFAKDPRGEKRTLVPVRVRACEPEGILGPIVYIDLVGLSKEDARQRLLDGVRAQQRRQAPSPPRFPRRSAVWMIPAGVVFAMALGYVGTRPPEVYRLRITVLGPDGTPVEEARVWSSIGGEAKQVAGGWEFTIPRATLPMERRLTVFASVEAAFLLGIAPVQLGRDGNPNVTLRLLPDTSAPLRGIVTDGSSRAIAGATVTIAGFPNEVATGSDGSFELPAHAAPGQQVQAHVEKRGYRPVTEWHPAGPAPVTIILEVER